MTQSEPGSRQVAWWPVHEYLADENPVVTALFKFQELCTALESAQELNDYSVAVKVAAIVGQLPLAGTPAWCALPDDDPRKLLALAAAGEHAVLRWETEQEARAAASHAIAAAADWSGIAQAIRAGHGDAYIPRRSA